MIKSLKSINSLYPQLPFSLSKLRQECMFSEQEVCLLLLSPLSSSLSSLHYHPFFPTLEHLCSNSGNLLKSTANILQSLINVIILVLEYEDSSSWNRWLGRRWTHESRPYQNLRRHIHRAMELHHCRTSI
jgi:hypothetical protein